MNLHARIYRFGRLSPGKKVAWISTAIFLALLIVVIYTAGIIIVAVNYGDWKSTERIKQAQKKGK